MCINNVCLYIYIYKTQQYVDRVIKVNPLFCQKSVTALKTLVTKKQ